MPDERPHLQASASRPWRAVFLRRDAIDAARVEMSQRQNVSKQDWGLTPGLTPGQTPSGALSILPHVVEESDHADGHGGDGEQKNAAKQADHHVMRHDGVKVRRVVNRRQRARGQCEDRAEGRSECDPGEQIVLCESHAERARPCVVLIRLHANLRQRLRHIDAELVRWRVLTRIEAFAAVVTEVRQVREVGLAERPPLFHRREDGTVLLAVATRIAHRHDVRAVLREISERHGLRSLRRCGRTRCQWSCRCRRCIRGAERCPT